MGGVPKAPTGAGGGASGTHIEIKTNIGEMNIEYIVINHKIPGLGGDPVGGPEKRKGMIQENGLRE